MRLDHHPEQQENGGLQRRIAADRRIPGKNERKTDTDRQRGFPGVCVERELDRMLKQGEEAEAQGGRGPKEKRHGRLAPLQQQGNAEQGNEPESIGDAARFDYTPPTSGGNAEPFYN